MRCFLGIDGGGSKTRALLCDEKLNTLAAFTGKGINFYAVGMDNARKNLKEVYNGVIKNSDIELLSVCIGCAALNSRAGAELTKKLCGDIIQCDNIILDSDLFIALRCVNDNGGCAIAVAGTGSMNAGLFTDGTVIHTGGWGHLLGDDGSGYAMSLEAVKSVLAFKEGYGEETLLFDAVLSYFGIRDINGLIDIFYTDKFSRSFVAGFAPVFFECVNKGDAVANAVMRRQAESFAKTGVALLKQMPVNTPLGLWGGIFQNHSVFTDHYSLCINKLFPETKIGLLKKPPEYGAVLTARKQYYEKTHRVP